MRTAKIAFGVALVSLGLLVALFPFISVWRASGETLGQLPEIEGAEFSDTRHRIGALFDDRMILASRTYPTLEAEQVRVALVDAGYRTHREADTQWQTMECCGEWDAVLVRAEDRDEGGARVLLTMADSDIQVSLWFFLILGLPMFAIGLTLLTAALGPRDRASNEGAAVPV